MNLSFAPVWSWPLVLLCCAAVIGVVALGYPRRIRHLSVARQRLLLMTRILLAALLLVLMLRPSLLLTSQSVEKSVIYVLGDRSRSMQTPDASGSTTRLAAQQKLLGEVDNLLEQFDDTVEIRRRSFSDSLEPWDSDNTQSDGESTSFAATLEELLRESKPDNVVAVILSSDGRQAAWGDADRSPVPYARQLGERQSPVYGVVHGSSNLATAGLDVALSELDITPDVFVRNVVPLKIRVRANGAASRPVRVRVLLEEAPTGNGRSGEMLPVAVDQQGREVYEFICDGDSVDRLLDLQIVPQNPGEYKVAVEAEPLKDEVRVTNNRVETIIRVRKGGIRVAYFDRPRAERRWLMSITVSSRVQLDRMAVYSGPLADRNRFDDRWFRPGQYDAFIIGDVSAEAFGKERLEAIRRCCELGAGLMMTGGVENFGSGGYQDHSIARLFPVDVAGTTEQLTGPVKMVPTETGLRHSVMQIASASRNSERWKDLPPLEGATVLKPLEVSLAQVLATTENGSPLLVGHNAGRSRVMAFGGDTTWQWYVQRDWGAEAFQRFWRQTIFWLTKHEQDSDGPVWVSAEPRDLVPGQRVDLSFGARDRQGVQLAEAEFSLTVTRPDGTKAAIPLSQDGGLGTARFAEADEPGDYFVRVEATHNGQPHGWATTRFLVNARDPELDNPSADPEMMKELAYNSGGDFLTPELLLERLEKWVDDGLPGHQMTRGQRLNLWDNWYFLLLFVGVMTVEWALRKKSGLV